MRGVLLLWNNSGGTAVKTAAEQRQTAGAAPLFPPEQRWRFVLFYRSCQRAYGGGLAGFCPVCPLRWFRVGL